MTKTEIALNAIKGMDITNGMHITMMETMRTLRLSTDEAVELRKMVGREWIAAQGERRDVLTLAKEVTNRYARDVSYR
jgi:hypothetical protein